MTTKKSKRAGEPAVPAPNTLVPGKADGAYAPALLVHAGIRRAKKALEIQPMAKLSLIACALLTGVIMTSTPAQAQSNTTGSIYGIASGGGKTSILIENTETNSKRTVTPDESGRYQATSLPPGKYKVTLLKDGSTVATEQVEVVLAQGAEVNLSSDTAKLDSVVVRATRRLVDNTATNSVSTFTAAQLANLPIAQDVNSIILLAPDTVKADARYAGGASIGGGAPSENSYYINGFPVTNALSQLGSIELPFGAIDQANVLTGGFGAEFGRSTGGVVNIVTKRGGNTWEGGASVSVTPAGLRASRRDIYNANTGQYPDTDGKLWQYNQSTSQDETKLSAHVGGPIIQDKLFVFLALEKNRSNTSGVNNDVIQGIGGADSSSLDKNGWVDTADVNNRWLGKIDWQINDSNLLELTTFGDNYQTDASYYAFDYTTLARGKAGYNAHYFNQPNLSPAVGGQGTLLKLTSNLTDALTATILGGRSFTNHSQIYNGLSSSGVPPGTQNRAGSKAPGITYVNLNPLVAQDIPPSSAEDQTQAWRFDLEWALGAHTLRGGADFVKLKSQNAGQVEAGGSTWIYRLAKTPNVPLDQPFSPVVSDGVPGSLASQGYYVQQHIFNDVTDARSDQNAVYLEDRWQVNKKLFIQAGLRSESFKGINGNGETYLDSKNFISPRLAGAYDWFGDSSFKLLGSAGRYSIQTPTHLAVRGASISTLTYQYFRYTGVNPANGYPTGLTALTPVYSPDGETGQTKDAKAVAAQNLIPSYQDEFRLGFEKLLGPKLVGSFIMTYRKLGATLDDFCDSSSLLAYAAAHGIDTTNWSANGGCISINPGRTNNLLVDFGNNKQYTAIALTPAMQGFAEKPKRTYLALDFGLEHPFADGWYGKFTYTWSQNKGNTEGQTKSDIGQTDVAATETWDFPQIMEGANGFLPNDRTHQIHAFGFYQIDPQFGVGGNLTARSGRPKNCFGNYGGTNPNGDPGYGSAFFYCSFDGGQTVVPTPRGSLGRLPWDYTLDLDFSFKPQAVKGLQMRVDIYNVLNKQTVTAINEIHESPGDPATLDSTYGRPIAYSAPRSVKFTADYAF